jgi:hypothetical protein
MAQTKADRQEAAQKAAATRQRNQTRNASKTRGTKAAASRQSNNAGDNLADARKKAEQAVGGVTSAARSVGSAATEAGKSVLTRAKILGR